MKSDNINETISVFAEDYHLDQHNHEELKIVLAWKYGICPDTFQSYFVKGIEDGFTINALVAQLTKKMEPEEKIHYLNTSTPIPRRICKSLPFLLTPAFFQLRLLNLNNKETGKIYNCQQDKVMFGVKVTFPDRYEEVSPFFKFDWRAEFYAFLLNPYAYYSINLLTCDNVIRNTERNVNNMKLERELGMISRKIYENVKKNKWTCTPTWAIEKMNYKDNIDELQNNYGLAFEMDSVYLKHIQKEETDIATFITLKMKTEGVDHKLVDNDKFQLSEEQLLAVKSSMSQPITVINALSGTGKTTIIKEIVRQITLTPGKSNKFVICSFTAKAVKRVQEVLGNHVIIKDKEGKMISCVRTIHSLMSALVKENIEAPEYIIIDESTMVSLSLFASLAKLVHYMEFNLIMLGDVNQLPPIKYGRPFEDMINSGHVESCKLTKNFRVKNGNDDPIIINSVNIINSLFYNVTLADNFQLLNTREERFDNDIRMLIKKQGITNKNAMQNKFITNTNDNNTKLNKIISDEIGNKEQKKNISCWMKDKKITMGYAVGDPVVFTKNNTYPDTFNGDQGIIAGFKKDEYHEYMIVSLGPEKNISVKLYPDREILGLYSVRNILLAYSITVHKSQGSEYDNVNFYIDGMSNKTFNNRRLTNTAITRAKEQCIVIEGDVGLFERACRENQSVHYGNLSERILVMIEGEKKNNRESDIRALNNLLMLVNRAPIAIPK